MSNPNDDKSENIEELVFTPSREEYASEAVFQEEIRKIFHRQWLLVGHTSQVRKTGDYYVKQVGYESLIIARGTEGELRAYFNVCRHRGYKMMDDGAKGCGARRFVCPYHQWSYDMDGKLKNAPGLKNGQFFEFNDYSLHEAEIDSAYGWIYVWLGKETPPPLADWLGSAFDENKMIAYGSEKVKLVHRETYDIDANWKSMNENDTECYHCQVGHPALARECSVPEFSLSMLDSERILPLRDGKKTLSLDGDYICKKKLGDGGESVPDGLSHGAITGPFFNAVAFFCDHAMTMELTPVSVDKSLFVVEWWVHEDAVENEDYVGEKVAEMFHITNLEDVAFGERNYEGILSSRFEPGPLHPDKEWAVIEFYKQYREMMAAD